MRSPMAAGAASAAAQGGQQGALHEAWRMLEAATASAGGGGSDKEQQVGANLRRQLEAKASLLGGCWRAAARHGCCVEMS